MDKNALESRNLFTENLCHFTFLTFHACFSTAATERTANAIKSPFCVLYIWVLVEERVAYFIDDSFCLV